MRVISMLVLLVLLLVTIGLVVTGVVLLTREGAPDLDKILGAQCLIGALFPLTGLGIIATQYAAADQLEAVMRGDARYVPRA